METDLVSALTLGLVHHGPEHACSTSSTAGTARRSIYTVADDYTPGPGRHRSADAEVADSKLLGTLPVQVPPIEGGTLFIEWGIGADMALGSTKVDKFRVEAMEGGTCTLSFRASTSDVSEEESGPAVRQAGPGRCRSALIRRCPSAEYGARRDRA
jgi:hypothetical protein